MLERVLEPEVMDTYEEADEYNSMDHAAVNDVFVDDLVVAGFAGGDVLDVGTGTAQIPVRLARRIPNCRIMAIDMSVNMLELGRYNLEIGGVTQHVQLAQVDAKKLPYSPGMFDWVISNSIVHHLPDPTSCLSEAVRVCRPGGGLFFRDLMRPATIEELEGFVETYTGKESARAQQLFRDSLHAALSLAEIRDIIVSLGFQPDSVAATSDRHWTWAARKPD